MTTTSEKLLTIAENVKKTYDAGMRDEYNTFWDNVFHKNDDSSFTYSYMFAGAGWNDNTFKPTYDIKPIGWVGSIFYWSHISDLTACLAANNVHIILPTQGSVTVQLPSLFQNCSKLVHVPELNLSKCINCNNMFYDCTKLKTIDGIIFSKETTGFNQMFYNCKSLTNCVVSGILSESLDLGSCIALDKPSIVSFINILSDTVTSKILTLSKTAVNTAFNINIDDQTTYPEGSEYHDLVNSKPNWSISYKEA